MKRFFVLWQQFLIRVGLLRKVNRKIKPGHPFFASNRTFYITLILSAILHIVLIYAIPAVELFSEGSAQGASELIMVDLFQEPTLEPLEVPQALEDQFLAAVPETPDLQLPTQSVPDLTLHQNPDSGIDLLIPGIEKSLEPDEQNLVDSLPQITRRNPVPQPIEKLPVSPELLVPEAMKPVVPLDPLKNPLLAPVHKESVQKQERPEDLLSFPVQAFTPKERQTLPETKFELGKRLITTTTEKPSFSLAPSSAQSEPTKRQQFGLTRQAENDQNRFGVFVGKKLEILEDKETIQDAVVEQDKQEVTVKDTAQAKQLTLDMQIEGPVRDRKIVYQPRPPKVDIEIAVELQLKFWVLPDGTIGDVIPIKRGDATLEQVAISYLKQWKFEPLPTGAAQPPIWGTIPIRFTVQ